MTNYHNGNFTFDGDFGYKLKGDYRDGGIHNEQGNVFFANVVFAYKIMKQLEPFFKLDFQSTESGKNKVTRQDSGTARACLGYRQPVHHFRPAEPRSLV